MLPALNDLETIDDEPRISDARLAACLGYNDPRDIRELIAANKAELATFGVTPCLTAKPGTKGGRPRKTFYLNEKQALLLCMFARTENAAQVRFALIDVFTAWRRAKEQGEKTVHVTEHWRRPPTTNKPGEGVSVQADPTKDRMIITFVCPYDDGLNLLNHLYGGQTPAPKPPSPHLTIVK